jgi:Flp pilus assembly protein TadD
MIGLQLSGCFSLHSLPTLLPKASMAPANPPLRTSKAKDSAGLPPKEAAEACIATAKELAANGHGKEAILLFERARQLNRGERQVSRYLAVLYDQQGNDVRALAEYEKALKLSPGDADLLNDLGYYYYRRRDWTKAEEQFRKAIAQAPDHERAWVNLGLALGEQRRIQDAFDAFAKVLGPAAAHSNVGVILASHDRPAEARVAFQKALDLQPDLPQARAFLAHFDQSRGSVTR